MNHSFKKYRQLLFSFVVILAIVITSCNEPAPSASVVVRDDAYFLKLGDSLVMKTFDTLRNTLMRTVSMKGLPGAVQFCNTEAFALSNIYTSDSVSLKRVSERFRNKANAPDETEKKVLALFAQSKAEKKELKSMLEKDADGNTHFFKPILVQSMCLNCHGDLQAQVKPEILKAIQQFYPNDMAIGYKEGDLRGMWHLVFRQK